jgi:hypothetical protein
MSISLSDLTPEQLKMLRAEIAQQDILNAELIKLETSIKSIEGASTITSYNINKYANGKVIEFSKLNNLLRSCDRYLVVVYDGTYSDINKLWNLTTINIYNEPPFNLIFSEWCSATQHIADYITNKNQYSGIFITNLSNLSVVHQSNYRTIKIMKMLSR